MIYIQEETKDGSEGCNRPNIHLLQAIMFLIRYRKDRLTIKRIY